MDFLFELLEDVVGDLLSHTLKSNRIPKSIRLALLTVVLGPIIALCIVIAVSLRRDGNVIATVVISLIALVLGAFYVLGVRKIFVNQK